MRNILRWFSGRRISYSHSMGGARLDSGKAPAQDEVVARNDRRRRDTGRYSTVALLITTTVLGGFIVWDLVSRSIIKVDLVATPSNAEVFHGNLRAVRGISISPDGRFLDIVQEGATFIRRDPESGCQLSKTLLSSSLLTRMKFLNDELGWVAINSHNEVELIRGDACIWRGQLPEQHDDDTLIECVHLGTTNRIVIASKQGSLWLLEVDVAGINSLRQSSMGMMLADMKSSKTGEQLVMISEGQKVLIWDPYREEIVRRIQTDGQNIRFARWSQDGQRLVTFGLRGTLKVWNVAAGTLVRELTIDAQLNFSAELSFDGTKLASGNGNEIIVWNLAASDEKRYLTGHTSTISCLAFADEGSTLFSGDLEGGLRRWSLTEDREVWSVP